jgi:hypothetical protein
MRDRPALTADPIHQQQTAMQIQTSITVGHEDLRVGEDGYLHRNRRSSLGQQPTRRVTNVLAEYI